MIAVYARECIMEKEKNAGYKHFFSFPNSLFKRPLAADH